MLNMTFLGAYQEPSETSVNVAIAQCPAIIGPKYKQADTNVNCRAKGSNITHLQLFPVLRRHQHHCQSPPIVHCEHRAIP